jgi:hypothetical protein
METRPSVVVPPLMINAPSHWPAAYADAEPHVRSARDAAAVDDEAAVPAPLARSRQRSFDPPPPRIFRVPP